MNTNHFPSLELCKKLTEIGFPETEKKIQTPNSDFSKDEIFKGKEFDICYSTYFEEYANTYVCPSVMEMLDVMPLNIKREEVCGLRIIKQDAGYYVDYEIMEIHSCFDTLPNALAEMCLWLHENKHISFNTIENES